ncbi:MAG TPA: hypothetical protein VFS64_08765 [Solirubrobacterales bacterium]|nr:hypothetical protein [Solirubrobacterales bacterium]
MKISEGKALAIVYAGVIIVFLVACAVLKVIGAKDTVVAFTALVVLAVGVQVLESVLHHYAPARRKRGR